jgi:hypothetical protein
MNNMKSLFVHKNLSQARIKMLFLTAFGSCELNIRVVLQINLEIQLTIKANLFILCSQCETVNF